MKQILIAILIPCCFTCFFVGLHLLFARISYRREQKRDAVRDKEVDRLLEIDPKDWYNYDFPNKINA